MERSKLETVVAEVEKTSKKLMKVVFGRRNAGDLVYFEALYRRDAIILSPGQAALVTAIRMTDDWENDQNRTFIIALGSGFNEMREMFLGRMSRALDSAEVAK